MTTEIAADEPFAPKRRTPRWIWALLVVSLAINLLIVGVVGGSIWAVRRGGYWDAPLFMERTHRFMRGLPEDRRAMIKSVFAEHRPTLQPYWREVRLARVQIGRLIEQGYEPEAFDAALADMFEKESRARQASRPMVAAMLKLLKPEERRHFLAVYMPYLNEMQGRPDRAAP
jgi:uncharacterized membrane protein